MEHEKTTGQARMLRIYLGENDRWEGKPLHEAIVLKLREMDIAGATVYQGMMGYGAKQRVHQSRFSSLMAFFGPSPDLPILITVVDKEEKINRVLPMLNHMVTEGLIVASKVEVIKYSHGQPDLAEFSLTPEHPSFHSKE